MIRPSTRSRRGFTMMEITAAIVVLSVVMLLVIQLLAFSRAGARANMEARLASSIAQGAFERLRGTGPEGLAAQDGIEVALPPEASRLRGAKLTSSVRPWQGDAGLRHVRVVLGWRSARNVEREIVREGLVSDHRAR